MCVMWWSDLFVCVDGRVPLLGLVGVAFVWLWYCEVTFSCVWVVSGHP